MSVVATCKACFSRFNIPDSFIGSGKLLVCPRCDGKLAIGAFGTGAIGDFEIATPTAIKVKEPEYNLGTCPYCNQLISPRPKRGKDCPFCGKSIRVYKKGLYTEVQMRAINSLELGQQTKNRREGAANLLRNAKDHLARDGLAEFIEIRICEDHNTCAFCRQRQGVLIRIAECDASMLPPFPECANEKTRQNIRDFGCRCWFSALVT